MKGGLIYILVTVIFNGCSFDPLTYLFKDSMTYILISILFSLKHPTNINLNIMFILT